MRHRQLNAVLFAFIFFGMFAPYSFAGSEWRPPDFVAGTWTGRAEVFAPFKKGTYPSKHPEDWIDIRVNIGEDGRVDGQIGGAKLTGCHVKKNRGWLGRLLNIKSDYIIRDGVIEGRVVPEDEVTQREFTVPFNIVDGQLKGGVMVVKRWEYPYPMFPRLNLEKNGQPADRAVR